MATLYVNNGGFRFPYLKWTKTSIPANLRFLQAQLDRFVHGHVISGTTLYVEKEGFRSPYALTRDNLEENMRFVEVQLDKFLHSHTTVDFSEVALDPEVDLTTVFPGIGDAVPAGSYFWVDSSNRTVEQSQTNPHIGSNHMRITVSGGSVAVAFVADPDLSEINSPITGVITPGETVVASVWGTSNTTNTMESEVQWLRANKSFIDVDEAVLADLTSSYQKFTHTTAAAPTSTAFFSVGWLSFNMSSGNIFDLDTFSVNGVDGELFVRDEGFRFPYGWKTDGDISMNRQFLETLISQFLHEHEVVA